MPPQRITPFLWFDSEAEEAANFYCSIFPNSSITRITRYGAAGPAPAGTVMTAEFQLDGQSFIALNGGPIYKFTEAISFMVQCETQAELDHYWDKLAAGGTEVQCGWLKDRYGLAWQITPKMLMKVLDGANPEKTRRAMEAMFAMKKLDIHALQQAYDGT